jgi:hypothetical protein
MSSARTKFANKLGWRRHLLKQGVTNTTRVAKYTNATTPRCTPRDREFSYRFRTSELRRRVLGATRTNVSRLDALGMSLLRGSNLHLIPRDKGCGYIAHTHIELCHVHESMLYGHENEVVVGHAISWTTMYTAYRHLCSQAAKHLC